MKILNILLLSLSLTIPSISFAIGGNDPIPGIDIIIKKNPWPEGGFISNFSLSKEEMKRYNGSKDHHSNLAKTLLAKLAEVNKKHDLSIKWDEIVKKGVNQKWCTPERCNLKTKVIIELQIPEDYPKSNIKFILGTKRIK
jgi:hypothetical protein